MTQDTAALARLKQAATTSAALGVMLSLKPGDVLALIAQLEHQEWCAGVNSDGHAEEKAELLARIAQLEAQAEQVGEPIEYQVRTRPDWRPDNEGWTEWEKCSAGSWADYRKTPNLHNWQYQTRELYLRPAPAALASASAQQAKPTEWASGEITADQCIELAEELQREYMRESIAETRSAASQFNDGGFRAGMETACDEIEARMCLEPAEGLTVDGNLDTPLASQGSGTDAKGGAHG